MTRIGIPFILLILSLSFTPTAPAKRTDAWLKKGSQALKDGDPKRAMEAYETAVKKDPTSSEAYYNLGRAYYRMEQYEASAAAFSQAASGTEQTALKTRSVYNLGNALYRTAEAMRETEPESAREYGRQAAELYRAALNADPDFSDAACNLELSWRFVQTISEQLKEDEQQEKQQNRPLQYLREKLEEFIERQSELIDAGHTGTLQQQLEYETRELAGMIARSKLQERIEINKTQTVEGPLKATYAHTLAAADAMQQVQQIPARNELVAALQALPEDQDQQQNEGDEEDSKDETDYDKEYEPSDEEAEMYEEADPFGDFSDYEAIRGLPPPNQNEMDILQEEIRNQERRKEKKSGEYKAVEKDW